jgi:hypothetical protein
MAAPKGRPTSYKPTYCNEAVEYLAQGYSLTAFAGEIGVCRDSVYNWMDTHPDFFDAIKKGRAKGQATWEKRLASMAIEGGGNATAIIFAMKNLYQDDWREKQTLEHTGKDGGPIEQAVTLDPSKLSSETLEELLNATSNEG